MSTKAQRMIAVTSRVELPVAVAVRVGGRYNDLLEVASCPLCSKRHMHGGGPRGSPAGTYNGPRLAHCLEARYREESYYVLERSAEAVA